MALRYVLAGVFLCAVAGALAGVPGESIVIDGVAAHVNKEVVTIGEVRALSEPVVRQLRSTYKGEELDRRTRKAYQDALEGLIERRLILAAFEKQGGEIPDWVVSRRVDEIVRDLFDDDRTALLDALAKDRITYEEWRERIHEQIVIASMRRSHVDDSINVPPAAVRRHYDEHLDEYRVGAKVRLRMIVLKKGTAAGDAEVRRRQAEDARKRVLGGEDFAAVARSVSDGTHAEGGGDWGWVAPDILRQELAEAATSLTPGHVSEAIETPGEFYIVKVEGRSDARIAPFADVQKEIEQKLRQEAAEELYREWVARLRKSAYIKLFEPGQP